jgi:hypothetical protein
VGGEVKTVVEVARDGLTPLRVFHRNRSNKTWEHGVDKKTRQACGACQGTSEAPPKEKP